MHFVSSMLQTIYPFTIDTYLNRFEKMYSIQKQRNEDKMTETSFRTDNWYLTNHSSVTCDLFTCFHAYAYKNTLWGIFSTFRGCESYLQAVKDRNTPPPGTKHFVWHILIALSFFTQFELSLSLLQAMNAINPSGTLLWGKFLYPHHMRHNWTN